MKMERFEIPGLAQYSYMISSSGEAVVIDPIRDIDRYTAHAASHGLTISHILETHIHADFASGSTALAQATGAELALSAYDEGQHYSYAMPHRALHNGEVVDFGTLRLQPLHTPGHTPEHLSFLLFDLERSATEPIALFSGDFLFVGSLGRPDLLGEQAKQELAHELFRSLHDRIGHLPDGVQVYPGHGAGSFCGAGMREQPESTLGYERATNPLFQLEEAAFTRTILQSVPPMPSYYPRMKALNAEGAPVLAGVPGARGIAPAELRELIASDAMVLDLRSPEAFAEAHVPGAINIGAGQSLSLWAGWLLDSTKRMVLVSDTGEDEESRRALIRVGLDRIEGSLAGGMRSWIESGFELDRTTVVSAEEVSHHAGPIQIVDVRNDEEWRQGHIEGAKHIALGELPVRFSELPKELPLFVMCGSGYRSSIAVSLLQRSGFRNVAGISGGMSAWNDRKLTLPTPTT